MKTSYMQLTETQVAASVSGVGGSSEVSVAIEKAEDLYHRGAGEMTVCRLKDNQIAVLSEFSMIVMNQNIVEELYTAPHGFTMPLIA